MTDIATLIKTGQRVRTRDRRDVAGLALNADGTITGTVPVLGACRWSAEGRYLDGPSAGAGPLDLVGVAKPAADGPQHGSVVAQIGDKEAKNSCCD
ncbi:hypothetical protein [Dongia rigui]|uniref:Uncharacterized protein n=1 Tax=Dongia rigui TaxID=940149 RepID=A0ABU5DW84_9PROT|nr:hypothetical protein [Dongia rigui]MDY0871566.1 hypothetical protein [Dongia rigui]